MAARTSGPGCSVRRRLVAVCRDAQLSPHRHVRDLAAVLGDVRMQYDADARRLTGARLTAIENTVAGIICAVDLVLAEPDSVHAVEAVRRGAWYYIQLAER